MTRRYIIIGAAVAVFAAVFLVLRSTQTSNMLKKIVLPELESMTGRKVIAKKISLNLIPLFAEAKEVRIFDDKGEKLLELKSAKAYADLSGIFEKTLVLRRIVVKEPEVAAERQEIEEVATHVKEYLARPSDSGLKVKVLAVEVQKGRGSLRDDAAHTSTSLETIDGEAILGAHPRIRTAAKGVRFKSEGWPDLSADAAAEFSIEKEKISIRKLSIDSVGSSISGSGEYGDKGGKLDLSGKALFSTVKKFFSLGRSGEGHVSAQGSVSYLGRKLVLDLKLGGTFYIQTLMELLKVKERVEGLVQIGGEVKGPLSDLRASGTVALTQGNLFDVDVDSLKCRVSYANGRMDFLQGDGRLYHGTAKVNASIRLPVVNHYTLDIDFKNVDSSGVFKLIGWDPGVEPGKVTGKLLNAGSSFNPHGNFVYGSLRQGRDVLGRVSHAEGLYSMQDGIVSLE